MFLRSIGFISVVKGGGLTMKSQVVVTKTKDMNLRQDYVALSSDYGTKAYFEREDVKEIYRSVFENLDNLDKTTDYTVGYGFNCAF